MALHTLDQTFTESLNSHSLRDEPDPMQVGAAIWRVLKSNRTLILSASLGCAVLAGIVAFVTTPSFTAVSSFIPPSSTSSSGLAAAMVSQLSSVGSAGSLLGGAKTSGDMYVGMLKSQTISRMMVDRFNLMSVYKVKKQSAAQKILAGHTEFAIGTKDTIVSVSVTDHDPARARDMANAYLDALRETSSGLALTENSQRRQFFEQRLALEKDQLANAEVALKQAQEKTGLIAPAGQTSIELQAIAQLRAQITAGEVRLATLRSSESDQNPEIIRLKEQLASLRGQVNQMENGKTTRAGSLSTAQVPELALEYVRRERDVKYHETLFEILAKQYENARLDEAHEATLQILDRAVLPDTKSAPHRSIYVLVGFFVGLLLSSAWALLRSLAASRKVQSAAVL